MVRRGVTLVFDASALIAQAKREPGAAMVDTLLADATRPRLVHTVNLSKVYYDYLKLGDEPHAQRTLRRWRRVGLQTRQDIDPRFWRAVARLKADIQRSSLADCFVIALALRVGGTVVTADHPSFDPVAARSLCPVTFIR